MSKGRGIFIALALCLALVAVWFLWNHFWVNRRVLWTYNVPGQDGIQDFACCADGGVAFVTGDELRYVDNMGFKRWQTPSFNSFNTGKPMHVSADQAHDRIYAVSYKGDVLAFDTAGNHLWSFGSTDLRPYVTVIDIAADGSITISVGSYGLEVLDMNGRLQHTILLEGYNGYYPATLGPTGNVCYIYSEALVFNGQTPVYPDSRKTYRRAVDRNGNELWKLPGNYMPAYDGFHPLDADSVLLANGSQGLTAFDARGEPIWSTECLTDSGDNIATDQERIYVSGYEGLRAFYHTGAKLWETEFPYWTHYPVLNGNGILYCKEEFLPTAIIAKGDDATPEEWETGTDYLVAVAVDTGEILWKHTLGEVGTLLPPKTRPDGTVVVGSGQALVCLQP